VGPEVVRLGALALRIARIRLRVTVLSGAMELARSGWRTAFRTIGIELRGAAVLRPAKERGDVAQRADRYSSPPLADSSPSLWTYLITRLKMSRFGAP
jgi:hypothetical protein